MIGRSNNFSDYDDKPEPGFGLARVVAYCEGEIFDFKILLPFGNAMSEHLNQRKTEAYAERDRQELIQSTKRWAMSEAKESKNHQISQSPSTSIAAKKIGDLDPVAERQALDTRNDEDQLLNDPGRVPVYTWDEPMKLIENVRSATADREVLARNAELFKRLKIKGNLRQIASHVDPIDQLANLEAILRSQPHFCAVIDLVRQQILLSKAQGKPLRLPPILLYGEPGVGKTHFTQVLAGALNTTIRRQSFDASTTAAALMGSDKHWSNSTFGLIFELICLGECANPVVLLDEIDKANSGSAYSYMDPLTPLHSLLEPITSAKVRDSSVGLEFDASWIIYVATANDPTRVPMSLRSRFVEFHIEPPTGAHALQVAQVIAVAVHDEMALPGFEPIHPQLVKLIAHLSAREQGQVLRRAFASAIANGRTSIDRLDLPPELLLDDQVEPGEDGPETNYFH